MERAEPGRGHLHREEEEGNVNGYKTFRTTMGHKVRVKMTDDEIAEQELFHIVIVLLPSLAFVLFAAAWLGRW